VPKPPTNSTYRKNMGGVASGKTRLNITKPLNLADIDLEDLEDMYG